MFLFSGNRHPHIDTLCVFVRHSSFSSPAVQSARVFFHFLVGKGFHHLEWLPRPSIGLSQIVSSTERTNLGLQRQASIYKKQLKSNDTLWPKLVSEIYSEICRKFQMGRSQAGLAGKGRKIA